MCYWNVLQIRTLVTGAGDYVILCSQTCKDEWVTWERVNNSEEIKDM